MFLENILQSSRVRFEMLRRRVLQTLVAFFKTPKRQIFVWVVKEMLAEVRSHPSWKFEAWFVIAHFFFSWFLMAVSEGFGSVIVQARNFWWFYFETATTIGFGDLTPKGTLGHIVTVGIFMVGIIVLLTLVAQFGYVGLKIVHKVWSGEMIIERENHIPIIGDRGERTKSILAGLLADKRRMDREIVLCYDGRKTEVNPFPSVNEGKISGVKARNGFEGEAWIQEASLPKAWRVGIDVENDNLALTLCLLVKKINPGAHIVVALQSMDKFAGKIRHLVDDGIECVPDGMADWFVRALQDKWSTDVLQSLSSGTGQTLYTIPIPDNFGSCAYSTLERYFESLNAQVIAVSHKNDRSNFCVNPRDSFEVSGGMVISYLHTDRVNDVVFWDELKEK